jgi:hypothetical protein
VSRIICMFLRIVEKLWGQIFLFRACTASRKRRSIVLCNDKFPSNTSRTSCNSCSSSATAPSPLLTGLKCHQFSDSKEFRIGLFLLTLDVIISVIELINCLENSRFWSDGSLINYTSSHL